MPGWWLWSLQWHLNYDDYGHSFQEDDLIYHTMTSMALCRFTDGAIHEKGLRLLKDGFKGKPGGNMKRRKKKDGYSQIYSWRERRKHLEMALTESGKKKIEWMDELRADTWLDRLERPRGATEVYELHQHSFNPHCLRKLPRVFLGVLPLLSSPCVSCLGVSTLTSTSKEQDSFRVVYLL